MKTQDEKVHLWTLPTGLSFARILSVPLICFLISLEENRFFLISFFLFVFAGITDGLDGFFARRLKINSKFGVYIDPVADKMLVASCLITLSYYRIVPLWLTLLHVLREFFVNGLRGLYASEGVTIFPGRSAKFKTALQILGISLILFNRSFPEPIFQQGIYPEPGLIVLIIALFFGLYSAAEYLFTIKKS
ncbi:MAG: CDP-diacylglycerol--glycerol-3-phosphate 3-phosphatidyltransferase [Desulfobacterota bacterium]|nr:CDP-diacylglycerol--glycerol-3-phosphate 3-phosphatidyltransferase [Thermodesulfobacteriota bacterium]MDW8001732.1 CDP-diacylglycerol--glycerol-3-phosphate 3-phosphatidyltransferase [Deltaproteobacteria bacterium]